MFPVFYVGVAQSVLAFRIKMGDRPDLHKIDVQKAAGLEHLVDLMKKCWDAEPNRRPSFGGKSTFVVRLCAYISYCSYYLSQVVEYTKQGQNVLLP